MVLQLLLAGIFAATGVIGCGAAAVGDVAKKPKKHEKEANDKRKHEKKKPLIRPTGNSPPSTAGRFFLATKW
ncbi:unnamed protein product [Sphenostylis stenocarpa]|uniref:Lipoprotein n=1 Tax=Sphenostylis stenocarpa TaxID=92480 RepID=A0AA86VX39_9FABA|nr:unnamed protein product [Sphenostylis stenocarpa]